MAVAVPNVPGVPSVEFAVGNFSVTLVTEDAVGIFSGSPAAPWGIYRNGAPVVVADNVVAFQFKKQWAISDYPVERGAFESYDKVEIPFDGGFRFTAGGSDARRTALLTSIDAIDGDLNLYDLVTPNAVYIGGNVTRYDYQQTAQNGVGLLQVDVFIVEVRELAGALLSSTQSPSDAAAVNGGPVQPIEATPSQVAAINPGTGSAAPGGF